MTFSLGYFITTFCIVCFFCREEHYLTLVKHTHFVIALWAELLQRCPARHYFKMRNGWSIWEIYRFRKIIQIQS